VQIRRHLGTVFHELARRKEYQIEEGHLMPDHVHMPHADIDSEKYSGAQMIGYLHGESSIWIAENPARRYFVSTVGRNEEMIRAYIRNEEAADKQLDRPVAIEARVLMKSRLSSQNPL
jgi:putative transposase